jgi:hypothetical protein
MSSAVKCSETAQFSVANSNVQHVNMNGCDYALVNKSIVQAPDSGRTHWPNDHRGGLGVEPCGPEQPNSGDRCLHLGQHHRRDGVETPPQSNMVGADDGIVLLGVENAVVAGDTIKNNWDGALETGGRVKDIYVYNNDVYPSGDVQFGSWYGASWENVYLWDNRVCVNAQANDGACDTANTRAFVPFLNVKGVVCNWDGVQCTGSYNNWSGGYKFKNVPVKGNTYYGNAVYDSTTHWGLDMIKIDFTDTVNAGELTAGSSGSNPLDFSNNHFNVPVAVIRPESLWRQARSRR